MATSFDNSELDAAPDIVLEVLRSLSEDSKVLLAVHLQLLGLNHEQKITIHLVVDHRDVSQLLNALKLAVLAKGARLAVLLDNVDEVLLRAVIESQELVVEVCVLLVNI